MSIMYYVYILKSRTERNYYKGCTKDLKIRFREHNSGKGKYSSTKAPYDLVWYCAFED
jgi:putative endonuclease